MPYDTLYNRQLLEIISNYNVANAMVNRPTNMSPELRVGSGRLRQYVLPEGSTGSWSNIDMFDKRLPIAVRGDMMESVGGVNRLKKAKKWMGFAGDVLDKGLSYKEKMGSGKCCGMCDGQGCEMCGSAMCGGKVNRLKKAKKWMGFAGDVMDKGLALKEQTGGVNRLKKAKKWMGFAGDVLDKGLSYKEQTGGVNRLKKAKKWMGFAGDVLDKGLSYKEQTGSGRKPRMVKGSQEAKDYMAKIRAMRKK